MVMQLDIFEIGINGRGNNMPTLPRTQTISIRLDPKLRYLCEIAARRQRRTISSFIEWSLESMLERFNLKDAKGNTESLMAMAPKLWDPEPADRFAKLAFNYPDLLNHHEEILWKLIEDSGWFWRGSYEDDDHWSWYLKETSLHFSRLREKWDLLNKIVRGEADKSELPSLARRPKMPPPPPVDDEDIPF
jgi:hypothetical protein